MTRNEFLDDVRNIDDLIDFCSDRDLYDFIDDLYSSEGINEILMEQISNMRRWGDVYSLLDNVPGDCDWYYINVYGDICNAEDYFADRKDNVLYYMDSQDAWYDEESEDEEEPEDEEEADDEEDDPDIDGASFIGALLGNA